MKTKTLSLMLTAALGMGALQAQDTKPIEGIWFAESTTAMNVESNENNLKEGFKDAKQFAVELPGQKEKTIFAKEEFLNAFDTLHSETIFSPKETPVAKEAFADMEGFAIVTESQADMTKFSKEEFLNAFDTPLSETILSPKETPVAKEAFADMEGFAIATESQADLTKFSKEEFLQALGEPIEMRIDFNPKYVVSIKAGELLIAEINGSGFTDRYKIKEVKKTKAAFLITTTLGEEFTLENNAGGLLLTKTKSLSKAPTMQMQLSK